jgi:hypothetical protein
MKLRFVLLAFFLVSLIACIPSATAEKIFGTIWLERYVPSEPGGAEQEAWATTAKKARCYVCHVKSKSKKYCNSYGDVLAQRLKSEDYEKERIEAEAEAVKAEIAAALVAAEAAKDACGTEFGALFETFKLPSTEMGAASLAKEQAAESDNEDQAE